MKGRRISLVCMAVVVAGFLMADAISCHAAVYANSKKTYTASADTIAGTDDERMRDAIGQIAELSEMAELTDAENESAAGTGIEGGSDIERLLEHYEHLWRRPLNVNSASKSDFQRLGILNDFQIASLRRYISEHGAVISFSELSLINGYNADIVAVMKPFVYLGSASVLKGSFSKDCSTDLYIRYGTKLEQQNSSPEANTYPNKEFIQLRIRHSWRNKIETAFLMEKDAGEPWVENNRIPAGDFISFGVAIRNIEFAKRRRSDADYDKSPESSRISRPLRIFRIDNLIIGDFSARFGQGLTLWNSFNFNGAEGTFGFCKRGEPVQLYTSADENNFFRGIAGEFSIGRITLSLIASYNSKDARLSDDGESFTTLFTDGAHDTQDKLDCKDAVNEFVAGANLTLLFNRIKLGFSFAGESYDKLNGRTVRKYNRYQMFESFHWNCASDLYTTIGKLRLFAEAAFSPAPHLPVSVKSSNASGTSVTCNSISENGYAVVAGGTFPLSYSWSVNFLYRNYSRSYIAPHAGAYSTLSSCSNQNGGAIRLKGIIVSNVTLSAGADYTYYANSRFNIEGSSYSFKSFLKSQWENRRFCIQAFAYCTTEGREDSDLFSYRITGKIKIAEGADFSLSYRGNTQNSFYVSALCNAKFFRKKLSIHLSGTCYDAREWTGRLYLYEHDLPLTFASALLYGNGFNWYAVASAKIGRHVELYAKAAQEIFSRSGIDNNNLKLKFGARIIF